MLLWGRVAPLTRLPGPMISDAGAALARAPAQRHACVHGGVEGVPSQGARARVIGVHLARVPGVPGFMGKLMRFEPEPAGDPRDTAVDGVP